tara:strand:- start:87 stop:1088 length:1002 start_codon:yes stop_codon:yes gene_type:complete
MAIRRFDPGSVKASTPMSDVLYRDTSPPFRLEDDYSGTLGRKDKERIMAHARRADPLTGEPRSGSYPIDFTTASGWDEGGMGMDPSKMGDIDYVRELDKRLMAMPDTVEDPYRSPLTEKRMDSYTGEMVDMPIRESMEPTTEEEYMSRYGGYGSAEAEAAAAEWDIELPSWSRTWDPVREIDPDYKTKVAGWGDWKEGSYTYRPEMAPWAKTMGMTPEMWTKGGEGLTPYDPRYISHGAGMPTYGGSILPRSRTDPDFHSMGTPDPFYYVRPGGKERLAETGKFRDFSRGGEMRPGYVGGMGPAKEKWFVDPVTEFTPSWLKPGMTSWPGMPE